MITNNHLKHGERERKTHRHRHRGRKRKTETHEDRQIKTDRCGERGGSHLCRDRRDPSVDCDAFDGFDSGSSYPLSSTNPSTHQQISKTSEGGVVVVCVCVSAVGSYRRGGGAHCSLDRGEVHHASDDLHHASGRCAVTVWVRVRCMSRCGALEQSTQVWVHMHELMQKQIKGVT
jgi:hypothetical protein